MTFQLKTSLSVSGNNSIQLIQGLTHTNLLIEILGNDTFVGGSRVERSFKKGYVFRLRWVQGGLRGSLVSASYGVEEFTFNPPNPLEPFDLEVSPNKYQFTYEVKIFEKIFNPRYQSLTEKLGIPLEVLERIPENTLILLESIDLMANTDTRKARELIEAAASQAAVAETKATAAQTKVDLTADSLAEAKTEMVLDRRFELAQSMFVLDNGFMVADVTHDLTAGKPQMSLTDAQGDDQGFAQLIAKSPTVARVELSMSQYNDNSYPMTFLLQGSKGSATVAALVGSDIGNGVVFSLRDAVLNRKVGNDWLLVDENVTAAKYRNGRVVYVVNGNASQPKISQLSNNWIPFVGSSGDWSPDEDNSPSVIE